MRKFRKKWENSGKRNTKISRKNMKIFPKIISFSKIIDYDIVKLLICSQSEEFNNFYAQLIVAATTRESFRSLETLKT